jgi:hypothetical protein
MLNRRRRLEILERSPLFQPPPDPLPVVASLALKEISDEHFELLATVVGNWEKGLCWALSQQESEALDAYTAAWELKCPAGLVR